MRREPGIAKACRDAARVYREAVAFVTAPPADCRIIQVAPAKALATGRTSRNRSALDRDYELGRSLGRQAIERFEALRGTNVLEMAG